VHAGFAHSTSLDTPDGGLSLAAKQAIESMHVCHVIVHRENIFEVFLVREDVNHPAEHEWVEVPVFVVAGFLGFDGAEHPELRMRSEILVGFAFRSQGENQGLPFPRTFRAWTAPCVSLGLARGLRNGPKLTHRKMGRNWKMKLTMKAPTPGEDRVDIEQVHGVVVKSIALRARHPEPAKSHPAPFRTQTFSVFEWCAFRR